MKCKECQTYFHTKADLIEHRMTHADVLQCNICKKVKLFIILCNIYIWVHYMLLFSLDTRHSKLLEKTFIRAHAKTLYEHFSCKLNVSEKPRLQQFNHFCPRKHFFFRCSLICCIRLICSRMLTKIHNKCYAITAVHI